MDWTTTQKKEPKKRTGDWTTKRGRIKRRGGRVEGGWFVWSVKKKIFYSAFVGRIAKTDHFSVYLSLKKGVVKLLFSSIFLAFFILFRMC